MFFFLGSFPLLCVMLPQATYGTVDYENGSRNESGGERERFNYVIT